MRDILSQHVEIEGKGRWGREGAVRLGDEMFSGPCCLFLEQSAALKATAAPCHCYQLTEALGNANLKPASHCEVYGGMPTVTQASNLETC